MRALLLSLVALTAVAPTVAAGEPATDDTPPVLQITSIARRADLDPARVQAARDDEAPLRSLLKTRKGKHRVFTFVGARWGDCKRASPCKVHPVLMLEVDKKGRIVDGYYFILEWAELGPPVWRVTRKGVRLRAGLALHELGLESNGEALILATDSILDDVYRGEQVLDADGIK